MWNTPLKNRRKVSTKLWESDILSACGPFWLASGFSWQSQCAVPAVLLLPDVTTQRCNLKIKSRSRNRREIKKFFVKMNKIAWNFLSGTWNQHYFDDFHILDTFNGGFFNWGELNLFIFDQKFGLYSAFATFGLSYHGCL